MFGTATESNAATHETANVPSGRRVLHCGWPALLLAAFCLLPFLNKPFIIDDPEFLKMARQILEHPLHPMDFTLCWNVPPLCLKTYQLAPGNTLMGYALVPAVLGGAREWMAHLTQLPFAWLAIWAMVSFVLSLGWSEGYATLGALVLTAVPPLLPMAGTAMPDVLALAVGLAGLERLSAWKAERRWQQGAVAAVALGLAGIARAHLALLLPLGAFFLLHSLDPRGILLQIRRSPWLWWPVLAGGAVLLAAIFATRETGLLLTPPAKVSGIDNIRFNLRYYLMFLCFPLPLAACWAAARWSNSRWRVVLLAALSVSIGMALHDKVLILAVIGGGVLFDLFWDLWKTRDPQALFLWLWLLVPLPIVYYSHFPIKYLLPSMPAVILIGFRLTQNIPGRVARAGWALVVIGGAIYSLLILRADAEFAAAGKAAMEQLVRPYIDSGERVWYGGDFSAYWYAGQAGAKLVVPGVREPARGDLLAIGIREGGGDTLRRFPNRTLVQSVHHQYHFGRTMWEGGGLYSNRAGAWLLAFGNGPDDRYELWRITGER